MANFHLRTIDGSYFFRGHFSFHLVFPLIVGPGLSEFISFVGTWCGVWHQRLVHRSFTGTPSLIRCFCFHHHTMAIRGRKPKTPLASKPRRKAPAAKHGAQAGKTGHEDEDTVADSTAAPLRVSWSSTRTERLLDWLENNVEDRQ